MKRLSIHFNNNFQSSSVGKPNYELQAWMASISWPITSQASPSTCPSPPCSHWSTPAILASCSSFNPVGILQPQGLCTGCFSAYHAPCPDSHMAGSFTSFRSSLNSYLFTGEPWINISSSPSFYFSLSLAIIII